MQARTYLPLYGKFAQVDPAYDQTKDDPESWNLYNYVTNNPVTNTDPDGRTASETTGQGEEKELVDPNDAFSKFYRQAQDEFSALTGNRHLGSSNALLENSSPSASTHTDADGTNTAQKQYLTKETLLKIGFTSEQATDLAAAHITVEQLAAAVITHEHRDETVRAGGDASGVQAGIIALMNRTVSEGWKNFNAGAARKAVTQEGLSAAGNTLLQAVTAKGQFHSLTEPGKSNRGFISDLLLGRASDAGFSYALNKINSFNTVSLQSFRQIWSSSTKKGYDLGGRTMFHSAGKSEPGGIIIGGHIFYQEGYR